MHNGVHVFIATTAGLVAIRAVQHRQGAGLASFVTISGGSVVAAITNRYREFVNPNTSPLPNYFPYDSYHMVIDSDITQGQSWQFACAIAHLLYANDNLGDGHVKPGDKVIIATGEIETGSAKVSAISHFAQKCLAAQNDLNQWQEQKCRVHFLVPQENYQQPIPDVTFSLDAVNDIKELESYLMKQGMISTVSFGDVATGGSKSQMSGLISNFSPATAISFIQEKIMGSMLGKALLCFVLIVAVWLIIASRSQSGEAPSISLHAELQQFDNCQDRQSVSTVFDSVYASAVSNSADNRAANKAFVNKPPLVLSPLPLTKLCSMSIQMQDFSTLPRTIWMISDSYARFSLQSDTAVSSEKNTKGVQGKANWEIPIPTWQKESRYYILMMFDTELDKSDEQSLEAYLKQLHQNKQDISVDSLSAWLYRQSLHAYFVRQDLEK